MNDHTIPLEIAGGFALAIGGYIAWGFGGMLFGFGVWFGFLLIFDGIKTLGKKP